MPQQPIPIYDEKETFYAPAVQIFVRGKPLPANIVGDILEVTYKDNVNEIDSCTLEVNNWDGDKLAFKFVPPLADADNAGAFDPGSPVEVWMGYAKNLRLMMRGQITTLAPHFTESTASTLSVTALNELHQFRTEQHTWAWTDGKKTDTQIAQELCERPVNKGQPGMGIKFEGRPAPDEKPDPYVMMNNQFDIVFLLERARRRGYDLYLKHDDDGKGGGKPAAKPTLFFGLSERTAAAPVYQLEWGRSLINFQPTLSTAKQASQVTVRGWDRKSKKVIEETYTLEKLWKDQGKPPGEVARLRQIAKAFGDRHEVITDKPVYARTDARQLARAFLEDQHKRMVEATGSTVGLPDLRAGSKLRIVGFGLRSRAQKGAGAQEELAGACSDFDGEYYVTQTTHTVGGNGYRTQFTARREGPVDPKEVVQP